MKLYNDLDNCHTLMWYYCDLRLSSVMPKPINNISNKIPNYYMYTIDICVKIMNNKSFPNVSSKDVYNTLIGKITPDIETRYPLYNWKQIWLNIHNKTVDRYDRLISQG